MSSMFNNEIQTIIDREGIKSIVFMTECDAINKALQKGWIVITFCIVGDQGNFVLGFPRSPKCEGGHNPPGIRVDSKHEPTETIWNNEEGAYICPECELKWRRKSSGE